jgi:PadR family transcriptional regulator PadR
MHASLSGMGAFRMTLQTQMVLKVLLERPTAEHYGLEIARQVGLPAGSIYAILGRLEMAGWVTSAWEDIDPSAEGRRPRRNYQLTEFGIQQARSALAETVRSITPAEDTTLTTPSQDRPQR